MLAVACMDHDASRDRQTHAVIGAAMEVSRVLGPGFFEHVYQDALAHELIARAVPFEREAPLRIFYKGLPCSFYRVDFVCYGEILVELKATPQISPLDEAQMINYLKAARFERGLILNFGRRSLVWKRLVFSEALHQGEVEDGAWSERIAPE